MKLSSGYIKTAFIVKDKQTGEQYDCFIQDYIYNMSGEHQTRFNIGINGWNEWSFLFYLSEEEFNERMEII